MVVVILMIRKGREVTGLRYAGIFGFVGAAFGVIIGMTTFFASQHFSNVSQSAEREANAVGVVAAMSGAFPPSQGRPIRAQLFCYATDVIEDEWQRSNDKGSPAVAGRERALYVLLLEVGRGNPRPYNWYSTALSSSLTVGQERQDRLLQSSPQIPVPLWILLYAGAALIVVFAFFFHLESRGQLIGMNVAVFLMLTAVVAVLAGLDAPTKGPFGQEPDAMKSVQAGLAVDLPPGRREESQGLLRKIVLPGQRARRAALARGLAHKTATWLVGQLGSVASRGPMGARWNTAGREGLLSERTRRLAPAAPRRVMGAA